MEEFERENWIKVKVALEEAGKTDTYFYQRAAAIAAGKPDPMGDPFKDIDKE